MTAAANVCVFFTFSPGSYPILRYCNLGGSLRRGEEERGCFEGCLLVLGYALLLVLGWGGGTPYIYMGGGRPTFEDLLLEIQ